MAIIGGLNSVPDVKVLVLYILSYAGGELSRGELIRIALDGGTAEYIDITEALDGLMNSGLIDFTSQHTPDRLYITELGRQTLSVFERELPYNVRRRNQAALIRLLAETERQREIHSDVVKKEKGYEAVCALLDGDDTMLEYRVFVPMQIQAQMITEQFKKEPIGQYKRILQLLIDEKLFEESDR